MKLKTLKRVMRLYRPLANKISYWWIWELHETIEFVGVIITLIFFVLVIWCMVKYLLS